MGTLVSISNQIRKGGKILKLIPKEGDESNRYCIYASVFVFKILFSFCIVCRCSYWETHTVCLLLYWLLPEKWLLNRRNSHANQNTNGATKAWHLTLKRMMDRLIGGLKARRLDRLLELLFGSMLPMFLYNIRRKAMGMVVNWKKEEVAISSVWAAENEMKNAKVWNYYHFGSEPRTGLYLCTGYCV